MGAKFSLPPHIDSPLENLLFLFFNVSIIFKTAISLGFMDYILMKNPVSLNIGLGGTAP
jgi:hypothetical protein